MRSFHRYVQIMGAAKHAGLLGVTVAAIWYGCAGTNTDYVPLDGGFSVGDAGVPQVDPGCMKLPNEDVPDDSFQDINCDGIDGDISRAIFVAPEGKDTYLGTPENPVRTIAKALALVAIANTGTAELAKVAIYLSKGDYNESVTLASGISLYGGYDALNRWTRSPANVARIIGGTKAVKASGITAATNLELLQIQAANGAIPSESSYGLFVVNSTGPITVRNARIQAGIGADGAAGANSVPGGIGHTGGKAQDACDNCSTAMTGDGGSAGASDCGSTGGKGGNGGFDSNGITGGGGLGNACTVVLGISVVPGGTPGGGASEPGCSFGSNPQRGGDGAMGCTGVPGQAGLAALAIGGVDVTGYHPASGGSGTKGNNGGGGGGGGGGSGGPGGVCNADEGAGGGAGGGGGCGATAGGGGGGGGASVAVFAYASKLTIFQTDLVAGKGGTGGKGGNGGSGGTGAAGLGGGSAANDGGAGGTGGVGGPGGNSGAGSGGSGGPSRGIWMIQGAAVDQYDLQRITIDGSGGFGGAGGTDPNHGTPGQSVQAALVQTS